MLYTRKMAAIGFVILTASLAGVGLTARVKHERVLPPRAASRPQPTQAPKTPAGPTTRSHPVYPYSVVPGGIHSVEDFRRRPDAIARTHYSGLHAVAVVKNPQDSYWYVSYRRNNAVFWTRRKLRVPAGETLVQLAGSASVAYARSRCGNLLSRVPQKPNLPGHEEQTVIPETEQPVPAVPETTTPEPATPARKLVTGDVTPASELPGPVPGGYGAPVESSSTPHKGDSAQPGSTAGGGIGGYMGGGGGPIYPTTSTTHQVAPVPEPSQLLPLAGALGVFCLWRRRRKGVQS